MTYGWRRPHSLRLGLAAQCPAHAAALALTPGARIASGEPQPRGPLAERALRSCKSHRSRGNEMPAEQIAILAAIGVSIAYWRQVTALAWKGLRLFVGSCAIEGMPLTGAVRSYCLHAMHQSRARTRAYGATSTFVKPRGQAEVVGFERVKGLQLFWHGWRPIVLKEGADDGALTLHFFRGTVAPDRLVAAALNHWNSAMRCSQVSRYAICPVVGRAGSTTQQGRGDKREAPPDRRPGHAFLEARVLGWQREDLGPLPLRGLATGQVLVSPDAALAIQEARFWLANRAWYAKRGIPWRRGWLLAGPPGCGKTTLARSIAEDLDLPIYVFDLSSLTNEEVRQAWCSMLNATPCMALLEDIDIVFGGRERQVERPDGMTFDTLLACIDGVERCDGVFVIVTTNRPELVDPSLGGGPSHPGTAGRPGRIDRRIDFTAPGADLLRQLAMRILPDLPPALWDELAEDAAIRGELIPQFQERCMRIALDRIYAPERQEPQRSAVRP